jgi:hypothetical protein
MRSSRMRVVAAWYVALVARLRERQARIIALLQALARAWQPTPAMQPAGARSRSQY